jgi:bifunctional UDP-N-acetylglucosamine pyrophosphorylase/glucosamine-1-phosphate N-acetyltransferase
VTIGAGAIVGAGSVITADVAAGDLAIARGKQEVRPGRGARFRDVMAAKKAAAKK